MGAPIDLRGAHVPVTTPFDGGSGDVDLAAFRDNLTRWFGHELDGVLVAGSTGESVFLDAGEWRALIEAARAVLPARARVIAGAGAESTRQTAARAREAASAGADAVLIKPPAYFKGAMTPEVLEGHYRAVADASPVPVVIYQVPLRMSTLDLPTSLIAALSEHDNVVGIKDSRGKLETVQELVAECADDFQVLVGSGALLQPTLEAGGAGGIMALGLLAPADVVRIRAAMADGRVDEAREVQARIAPVHHGIVGGMGVPGVKAALDVLGMAGGAPRPPLAPLPEARVDEVRALLEGAGLLEGAPA